MLDFLHTLNEKEKETLMDKKRIRRAIQTVARRNGTTVDAVLWEMEETIEAALADADAETVLRWKAIPCAGTRPDAYELIDYLYGKLNQDV